MIGLFAAGQVTAADTGVAALIQRVRGPAGAARSAAERELAVLLRAETRRAARIVTRPCGRRAEELAADAAHGVWLNVTERFDPAGGRCLRGFVHEAVKRVAIDAYRRDHAQRRGGGTPAEAFEPDSTPGNLPDPESQAIARDAMRRALDSLPDAHREVVLRVLRGEPQNEIAASLGRHPSQITRLIQRVALWLGGAR